MHVTCMSELKSKELKDQGFCRITKTEVQIASSLEGPRGAPRKILFTIHVLGEQGKFSVNN